MKQSYNPFSLVGKTVLVTGASSGIGRATAIECSKMGANIVLSAPPEESKLLMSIMNEMPRSNGGISIISADLKDDNEIHNLAVNVGSLDGVVFAAGTIHPKPLVYYSNKNIQEAFSVNTFACMSLTKELVKARKLNDNGSLVFISSAASCWVTMNTLGLYSASKAAIDSFMKQCAVELADRKIRSNTINPGIIRTKMLESTLSMMLQDPETVINAFENNALSERIGTPEEVAWMAIYLLSDASRFVTGSSLLIDGGAHICR